MKLFGFAGFSGAGKTTLIEKLIPLFLTEGFRVSVIKYAHHDVDIDRAGKDSWRHRQAGANEVILNSKNRWALMHEARDEEPPTLDFLAGKLSECDIVLVEGGKKELIPKIEINRGGEFLFPSDPHIVAIVAEIKADSFLPQFHPDDVRGIGFFIKQHLGFNHA